MGNGSSKQSQGDSDPSFSVGAGRTNRFEERYFGEGSECMRFVKYFLEYTDKLNNVLAQKLNAIRKQCGVSLIC